MIGNTLDQIEGGGVSIKDKFSIATSVKEYQAWWMGSRRTPRTDLLKMFGHPIGQGFPQDLPPLRVPVDSVKLH